MALEQLWGLERDRVLEAASRFLGEAPITITSIPSERSAGGPHDYHSEGDYWWPNPDAPEGPYIRRDGHSNPANFNGHRMAMIRFSIQVATLATAWLLSGDDAYADWALRHLRAWFLDPQTLMNPHLRYAQAIWEITDGRAIGIIDSLHLIEVVRAMDVLHGSGRIGSEDQAGLESWIARYLSWLTDSEPGCQEREEPNNHGTAWVVQVAEMARYLERSDLLDLCRDRYRQVLVPRQMAADGSFPLELERTRPYGYSLFNLDLMATVCQILATPLDDLFHFQLSDGRGMARAMEFMVPFIADKGRWPHPPDVEHFEHWPVRQPSLLFAGFALGRPDYVELWRRLSLVPEVPEMERNQPIRQPILWFTPPAHLSHA